MLMKNRQNTVEFPLPRLRFNSSNSNSDKIYLKNQVVITMMIMSCNGLFWINHLSNLHNTGSFLS